QRRSAQLRQRSSVSHRRQPHMPSNLLPWTASMTAPVVPRHAAKSPTPLFQLKLASLQTAPHPARIDRRAFGGVPHQNGQVSWDAALSSLSRMLKAQAVVSLKFADSRLTLVLTQVS